MNKNHLSYTIIILLCLLLFTPLKASAQDVSQENSRMERGRQMMENNSSRMGNRQGISISCENLKSSLDKRIERLDKAGEKRAQVFSNIEKSVKNRIDSLKLQNKNTDTISDNFDTFEQKYNEYYGERSLFITRIKSLKDQNCSDGDIEAKKSFVSEIKKLNQDYKTHLKEFRELSSYLRDNVFSEIRKLRGNE